MTFEEHKLDGKNRTVFRILEILEIFAKEGRPLTLTELSEALDAPVSSSLVLIRTMCKIGYLYEVARRQGYYPSHKIVAVAEKIAQHDAIVCAAYPILERLQELSEETVVLGKLHDPETVLYVKVFESNSSVRYSTTSGTTRPLYINSIGRSILLNLGQDQIDKYLSKAPFPKLYPNTLATKHLLEEEFEACRQRGYAQNIGESHPDLASIGISFRIAGSYYGVSLGGPIHRMQARWDNFVKMVLETKQQLNECFAVK